MEFYDILKYTMTVELSFARRDKYTDTIISDLMGGLRGRKL